MERASISHIDRHLYLVPSLTDYLVKLYKEGIQKMIDHYYPKGHPQRQAVEEAFEQLKEEIKGKGAKKLTEVGKARVAKEVKKARKLFIGKYFVNPIAQFWTMVINDQNAKWENYNQGIQPKDLLKYFADQEERYEGKKRNKKKGKIWRIKEWTGEYDGKTIDYIILPDRAIRMMFENFIMEEVKGKDSENYGSVLNSEDPVTKFGLNQYLDIDALKELKLPKVATRKKTGDSMEDALFDIKIGVARRYQAEGLKQPSFPVKLPLWLEIVFGILFVGFIGLPGVILMSIGISNLLFHTTILGLSGTGVLFYGSALVFIALFIDLFLIVFVSVCLTLLMADLFFLTTGAGKVIPPFNFGFYSLS